MTLKLTRIDERLVHGQVAYSWSVAYPSEEIIVIDDDVADDEMQKTLLEMAVPEGKSFNIFNVNDGISYLREERDINTFLVVKSPGVVLRLTEAGINFDSINIGGMYFKEGKKEVSKTVYLNEEEISIFKKLSEMGIKLDLRTSPGDKSVELSKLI